MKPDAKAAIGLVPVVMLALMLTGCVSSPNQVAQSESSGLPTAIVTPHTPAQPSSPDESTIFQTSIGAWSLHMPRSDLEQSLKNLGISYRQDKDETGQVWFITDDINFGMTQDGFVLTLSVRSSAYATSLGVRVGDPSSKVEQLYGDGYDHDDYLLNFSHAWEYSNGDVFLRFILDDNQNVSLWEIATYSLLDL